MDCAVIGLLSVASGIITVGWLFCWIGRLAVCAITWIKYGEWPQYLIYEEMRDIPLPIPHTDLVGIQKIFDWTMEQSATSGLFVLLGLFGWLTASLSQAAADCQRAKRNAERAVTIKRDPYTLEDLIEGKDPPNR
ncbi:hypothetical protein CV770_02410 [Bradyrhizobium sp. AC87j1]|uniref:hypothetical protein n=1 Tax=Bradyrhizobium sp. AC87j1 TaxID=2055894 RepID=UPI000CECBB92|nr:hypothetical protein [Bradyrhizobium sp. AC87j1]PPQ21108.1 hypothetical protein CV770_02410 [Bradyrhizobium sp. AC87j1]